VHNINEVYGTYEVDPELIATQDPDFVFMTGYGSYTGDYTTTEPSNFEQIIGIVSNRPEFSPTTAVTNGDVYVFEGINPDEIAEEYFEEWVRVPYQGIFFWPEP
jgi:iron complex transport system substrate-binding protein